MRRAVISVLALFVLGIHASCKLRDVEMIKERQERSAEASRSRERAFQQLLGEGKANLDAAMMLENRETDLMRTDTDSPEIRRVLESQRAILYQARGCFEQALRTHPDSILAHQGIALAAAKLGLYDEAIKHGLIVLESSETRDFIYIVIRHCYWTKAGRSSGAEAVENLTKAIELMERFVHRLDPPLLHYEKNLQARLYLEKAEILEGRARTLEYDKAIALLKAHLAGYPNVSKDKNETVAKWGLEMGSMLAELKVKRQMAD